MGNETTLNHSAIRTLCLWALCCGALCLQGCLELVRRPPADTPVVYQPAAQLTSPADTASTPQREVVIERPKRSRKQRQSIEQVNEYALWCIQNAMWNEARSHMERTLGQDSLSASLHNNLGIIYERMGLVDKAADFYGRARALNPAKKAYAANLTYFTQRQQTNRDSTAEFNIFQLDERDPRRQGTRRPEDPPTFTGE